MMPISNINTGAVRPLISVEKVLGTPNTQKPEEEGRLRKPVMDEYIPEEPREPSGRYWMGKDENGQPKIYVDGPERAADAPSAKELDAPDADVPASEEPAKDQGAKGPEKKDPKEEKWVCDTGKVDREIEKLKKKQQELEQRLNTETDEAKRKDLERQLSQTGRELSEKDNDTYRKNHSTFTRLE